MHNTNKDNTEHHLKWTLVQSWRGCVISCSALKSWMRRWGMNLPNTLLHSSPIPLVCSSLSSSTRRTSLMTSAWGHDSNCLLSSQLAASVLHNPLFTYYYGFHGNKANGYISGLMILSVHVLLLFCDTSETAFAVAFVFKRHTLIRWLKAASPAFLTFFSLWAKPDKHLCICDTEDICCLEEVDARPQHQSKQRSFQKWR